jgi:hypothetical protein
MLTSCGAADVPSVNRARGTTVITSSTSSASGYLNDGDNDPIGDADNDNTYDNDKDNAEDHVFDDNGRYHDRDDTTIVAFGHVTDGAVTSTVTKLVEHYYAAAAQGHAADACSMLLPAVAHTAAQTYAQAGPAYLRGAKTCPEATAALFTHLRRDLAAKRVVSGVRANGDQAFALLGSNTAPADYISLVRARGSWWIDELIGEPLP